MQNTNENFSFKKYAWNQFKKNKIALVSLYLLFVLILIAVFAPYIANDRPLYCVYEGNTLYPAFVKETRTDSIFNPEGEFVTSFTHDDQFNGNEWWDLKNGNNQEIAPGLYIYVVQTPSGAKKIDKFAVIR